MICVNLPYCLSSLMHPSSIQIYWHNLRYVQNPHPIICQTKMKTCEELWLLGCRTLVLEAL